VSVLEQRLVELGSSLDVPEAPDVASVVLEGIAPRRRPLRHRRRLVLALAVVVLAALLAVLAIPDARSALERFLQIGGARIELVDELPTVPQTSPELELTLGERVSLEDARRRAGFDLLELEEKPDAVFVGERGTVWFLYGAPGSVRLLVAQTPALGVDAPFILKKLVESGTSVAETKVHGQPAYFLSGAPHVILLLDEFGVAYQESMRLARDVLLWEEKGRTVRLEGELTGEQAVELAESLR
jgi:hypothetical protein